MTTSPRPRRKNIKTIVLAGGALAMAAGPIIPGVAMAQGYGQPGYGQPQYDQGQYNQGQYNQGQPYQGQPNGQDYDNAPPPPEPGAPSGYDGTRPPPPPPGYTPDPNEQQYAEMDRAYAQNAEAWARNNCVKSRGNVAGGAAVGGILGALIGGALGGRHDRGAGVLAGAAVGAVGGAAVASSTGGETSPGCPPGFVVRRDAPAWGYAPAGYYYAAPAWYRPWVFIDGGWVYRPYPYHNFYYRHWRAGPGWRGYGYHGGWHGDHWRH